ncbi:MAG: stage III sporulation protein AB [Oscillospiraceae bacterium]
MNWLRYCGIAMLALSCALGGIWAGQRCKRRVFELERACSLLSGLLRQMKYTLAAPPTLLDQLAAQPEYAQCDYLLDAREGLAQGLPFLQAWENAVRNSEAALNRDDRTVLAQIGAFLGMSDLETQDSQLSLLAEQLAARLAAARDKTESSAKLSSTLGALLGLALAVLII